MIAPPSSGDRPLCHCATLSPAELAQLLAEVAEALGLPPGGDPRSLPAAIRELLGLRRAS